MIPISHGRIRGAVLHFGLTVERALVLRKRDRPAALQEELDVEGRELLNRPRPEGIGSRKEDDRLEGWRRMLRQEQKDLHLLAAVRRRDGNRLTAPVVLLVGDREHFRIERLAIVRIRPAVDFEDLIGHGLLAPVVAAQPRQRREKRLRGRIRVGHASKPEGSRTVERRACVWIVERVDGLVPATAEDVPPSVAGVGRRPFLDVARHVQRPRRVERLSRAAHRRTAPAEIAERHDPPRGPRFGGFRPMVNRGEVFSGEPRIGRSFVPTDASHREVALTCGVLGLNPRRGSGTAR